MNFIILHFVKFIFFTYNIGKDHMILFIIRLRDNEFKSILFLSLFLKREK